MKNHYRLYNRETIKGVGNLHAWDCLSELGDIILLGINDTFYAVLSDCYISHNDTNPDFRVIAASDGQSPTIALCWLYVCLKSKGCVIRIKDGTRKRWDAVCQAWVTVDDEASVGPGVASQTGSDQIEKFMSSHRITLERLSSLDDRVDRLAAKLTRCEHIRREIAEVLGEDVRER